MLHHPGEPVALVSESDIAKAKRIIYDMAKTGKIVNYGGKDGGQARWDLVELHRVYKARQSG